MIRIGDLSRISQVSVKTLRYYDEVGLLHPAHVDDFSGYRYYSFDQLARLHRILALKDLGFSLEQIGRLLQENVSAEQLRGVLKLRKMEIEQQVAEELERLSRVEARLRQIEQENMMEKIDVVIKKLEATKIASVRDIIPTYSQQGRIWNELEGYLASKRVRPTGPCLTIYHDDEYKERDVDAEVCEPVAGQVEAGTRVKIRILPGVEVASAVHRGPYVELGRAIEEVIRWTEENGYRINGPQREIYLQPGADGRQNDPNTVTEIQFPVEKVK